MTTDTSLDWMISVDDHVFVQRAQQVADKQHAWASDSAYKLTHGDRHLHSAQARTFQLKLEGADFRQTLREHVFGCFIDDEVGADIAIKYLGADNVMAESDYPTRTRPGPTASG